MSLLVTIQLPYCVSMLLLTSGCKFTPVQYTNVVIIWCLCKISQENKAILTLCKPLFVVHVRVKGLYKLKLEYKNEAPKLKKWAWHMHDAIV